MLNFVMTETYGKVIISELGLPGMPYCYIAYFSICLSSYLL